MRYSGGEPIMEKILGFLETVSEFDNLIKIIGAGTFVASIASYYSLITSSSIEVAFMTKKEQWKRKITISITLFVLIWVLNILCGYLVKNDEVFYVYIACIGVGAVTIAVCLLLIIGSICVVRVAKKVHICRFIYYILIKLVLNMYLKFIHPCKLKCLAVYQTYINKVWSVKWINFIRIKFVCILSKIHNVWDSCKYEKKKKKVANKRLFTDVMKDKIVILMVAFFVALNCASIRMNEYSLNTLIRNSTIISLLLYGSILLLVKANSTPGTAKVYFMDDGNRLYILFRYNDKYCVGGEMPRNEECKEYRLISFEELHNKKIYSTVASQNEDWGD